MEQFRHSFVLTAIRLSNSPENPVSAFSLLNPTRPVTPPLFLYPFPCFLSLMTTLFIIAFYIFVLYFYLYFFACLSAAGNTQISHMEISKLLPYTAPLQISALPWWMKGLNSRLFVLHQTTPSVFSLIIPNKCSKTKIIEIILLILWCAALIVLQDTFRLEAFVVNFKTVELMLYSFVLTVLWKNSQPTNPGTYALLLYAVPY